MVGRGDGEPGPSRSLPSPRHARRRVSFPLRRNQRSLMPSWAGMAVLRLGAAGVIGGLGLLYTAPPAHPAPGYVRPVTFVLVVLVAGMAVAQLRWPTSRRLALASLAVDVVVVTGLQFLYAFDPRRYLFALVFPVQAEATVILGLAGGLAVWAAVSVAYGALEFVQATYAEVPVAAAAVGTRLAAGLFVVLVTGILLRVIVRERKWFMSLLETAPDPIVVTDSSGRVIMANEQAERAFGHPREELLGKPIDRLFPEGIREAQARERDKLVAAPSGRPRACLELVARRSDGTEFPIEVSLGTLTNGDVLVTSVVRDISERKEAEESLRESETRLRLVLEQLPAIVWTTDADLRLTSSTGAGLAAIGLLPGEVVGMPLAAFLRTEDPSHPSIAAHRRALGGEPVSYDQEWVGRAFQVHLEPLRTPEGEISGVIGLALDVTERRRAEARYRALVEAIPAATYVDRSDETSPTGYRNLYMSPQIEAMVGYPAEEFTAGPDLWRSLLHPDDREAVLAEEARHTRRGSRTATSTG